MNKWLMAERKAVEADREKVRQEIMEMGFNRAQAEVIEKFAYRELHSHWNDYLTCWDEYADLCMTVIHLENEK